MINPDTNDGDGGHRDNFKVTLITISVLVIAVGFNLVLLYPESMGGTLAANDSVFHMLLAGAAVEALNHGKDVTDPWQRTMSLGFPVFHYYQHLPHITVALFHFVTMEVFPLFGILRWTTYLLLSIFPLSIYWSLRRFDFHRLVAAMGGLIASLIGSDFIVPGVSGFYNGGLGHSSYVFHGAGLYSQLWAMVLLPPALAMSFRVLMHGKCYFWAVLLLAATLMSHLMYGYMAFITLGAFTFIGVIGVSSRQSLVEGMLLRWRRLITLFVLVLAVTSYFLIPVFLDREYFNSSVFTAQVIKDSFGHQMVLRSFIGGDLFDWDRFPSFTILVSAGIGICVIRWREKCHLIPVSIFFLWLVLMFGRSTWGSVIDLLPLSHYLHMHRFIGGIHLAGIFLAAVALGNTWRWVTARSGLWPLLTLAVTLLLLAPVYIDRQSYLAQNSFRISQSNDDLTAESSDLDNLVKAIEDLPPGRVYAGTIGGVGNWGDMYRVNCPEVRSGCIPVYVFLHSEGLDVMSFVYHGYSLSSDTVFKFDENLREHYDIFNVRYVVAPENQWVPDFVRPLQNFGRHRLYQVDTSGYFDLVGSDLVFAGTKEDFYAAASSWLLSGLPNVKRHPKVLINSTYTEIPLSVPLSQAPEIIANTRVASEIYRGDIISQEVGSDFFSAKVNAVQKSLLLLKTSYHPNWGATVNGVGADTVMVMPGFMGVQLYPGTHEVYVEYKSRSIRKILLGLGALTLLLIPIAEKRAGGPFGRFTTKVLPRVSGLMKGRQSTRANRRRRRR